MEERFDVVTKNIASKMGMSTIPWFKFTYYLTLTYAAVTCLVLFYREDFFNVSEDNSNGCSYS
jgi:hypothetical protein